MRLLNIYAAFAATLISSASAAPFPSVAVAPEPMKARIFEREPQLSGLLSQSFEGALVLRPY